MYFVDVDRDGFGDTENTTLLCELIEGYSTIDGDCDDQNADVYPDAEELCDGLIIIVMVLPMMRIYRSGIRIWMVMVMD